jgi:hypothetical protein
VLALPGWAMVARGYTRRADLSSAGDVLAIRRSPTATFHAPPAQVYLMYAPEVWGGLAFLISS